MTTKRKNRLAKRKPEVRSPAELQAERIINQIVEREPRLRAAREASRRSGIGNDENIVESTLSAYRQRLKK